MKKLSLVLCAFAMLITLSGCKDARAEISNGNEEFVSVEGVSITKDDIYQLLKANAGNTTITMIQEEIAKKEDIKLTDDMKKEAKKSLKELKKSFGGDEAFKSALKQYGFKDENDYLEKASYPAMKTSALMKKYATENKKAVFEKYHPVKAVVIQAASKEKATSALEALKNNEAPKQIVADYGKKEVFDGSEKVYYLNSGLPAVVFDKIAATTKAGVIDEVIEDAGTQSFFVVKIVNLDPEKYSEEAIDAISKGSGELNNDMLKHYLKKYNFTIYDIDIYNQVKRINEGFIVQK